MDIFSFTVGLILNFVGCVAFFVSMLIIVLAAPAVAFMWWMMLISILESREEKTGKKNWWLRVGMWPVIVFVFFFTIALLTRIIPETYWRDGPHAWQWGGIL